MSKVPDDIIINWEKIISSEFRSKQPDWDLIAECLENCDDCISIFEDKQEDNVDFTLRIPDDKVKRIINAILSYKHRHVDGDNFSKSFSKSLDDILTLFLIRDETLESCAEYIVKNNITLSIKCHTDMLQYLFRVYEKYNMRSNFDFDIDNIGSFIYFIRDDDYLLFIFDTFSDEFKLHDIEFVPDATSINSLMEAWIIIYNRGYKVDLSIFGYTATYHLNLLNENKVIKDKLSNVEERLDNLEKENIDILEENNKLKEELLIISDRLNKLEKMITS